MEWETTIEDLENVLRAHGKLPVSQTDLQSMYDGLDYDDISNAALYGDDMDEQTNYAYQEIENQLRLQPSKFE